MRAFIKTGLGIIVMMGMISLFSSCDKDDSSPRLSAEEENSLLFMLEEEKLARDVYLHMFRKYDQMVFDHISGSEQSHMDAIAGLIEKYDVTDRSATEEGRFNDPALQDLYDQLIQKGDSSLVDALTVGATIEDLDIRDLELASASFSNEDLLDVYSRLACGSRNHIRAFTRQLEMHGESYQAQFISQAYYESIIAGSHESCGL